MTESDKQQQKLAALGMLSAGIAHEIQNPLNFVINFSKMSDKLLQDLKDIILEVADDLNPDDAAEIQDIADDLSVNMQKIREPASYREYCLSLAVMKASICPPTYLILCTNTYGSHTMQKGPMTSHSMSASSKTSRRICHASW